MLRKERREGKKGIGGGRKSVEPKCSFPLLPTNPFFGYWVFRGKDEDELLLLLLCCVSAKRPPLLHPEIRKWKNRDMQSGGGRKEVKVFFLLVFFLMKDSFFS